MKLWQKILSICAICLSLVLTLGGFITLAIVNFNLDVGGKVDLIYDGQHIYAQTAAADGYFGYRFKFESEDEVFTYNSDSNSIDLSKVSEIELGKTYLISVCYRGEIEGANSSYGEALYWTANAYLSRPEIKIENNTLSWEEIDNADYYIVKYGKNNHRTTGTSVDLAKLVGGKYDIAVTAHSDNENYLACTSLTLVDQAIIHQILPFQRVELGDEEGKKILSITGSEVVSKIDVVIGGQTFQFNVDPSVNFKLDITRIYKKGAAVGASPARIDDYNIYTGAVTYVS